MWAGSKNSRKEIFFQKKYTLGPRYWNVPVLANTETFLVYQYCPSLVYLYLLSIKQGGIRLKLTTLEQENGPVGL